MGDQRVIVLASLPWPRLEHLSIQTATLAAYLGANNDWRVIQRNYARDLLAYVTQQTYAFVVENSLQQYEAAYFLFGSKKAEYQRFFARFGLSTSEFSTYIEGIDAFFEDVTNDLVKLRPTVVGFTTTFLQFLPAMEVARRAKRQIHFHAIVGGAGWNRTLAEIALGAFPQTDSIAFGEGECTLSELLKRIEESALHPEVAGLAWRNPEGRIVVGPERSRIHALDLLPQPDFTGQLESGLPRSHQATLFPTIVVEAARGCFYGKCSFCNLNEQWGNTYRRKADIKVIREIAEAVREQKTFRIMFADTDVSNRSELFKQLAHQKLGLDLILEVSGHADGRRIEFFRAMRDAGASQIQIGIEAFSPRLLKLLKKGIPLYRNLEMLKWCSMLGIRLFYNVLCHIPGEQQFDVDESLRLMRSLWMFEPPARVCPFVLAHDSPAYRDYGSYSIVGFSVPKEIRQLFPGGDIQALAPLLTPIVGYDAVPATPYADWKAVDDLVSKWKSDFENRNFQPGLVYRFHGTFLTFEAQKYAEHSYYVIEGLAMQIYLAIDSAPLAVSEISKQVGVHKALVYFCLEKLIEFGCAINVEERYFGLGIDVERLRPRDISRGAAF